MPPFRGICPVLTPRRPEKLKNAPLPRFCPELKIERNRMKIKLLNSLVGIKTNCDMECTEAYDLFISSPELLKKTKSSEKYDL